MRFFEKEITTTKSVARLLLEAIINGIIISVIVYLFIGPLNKVSLDMLNAIKNNLFTAETIFLIFLPIFMILSIIITLVKIVINNKK